MSAEVCRHLPEQHRPDCPRCAGLMAATIGCPDCGTLSVWLHGAAEHAGRNGLRFASLWWTVHNAVTELGDSRAKAAVAEAAERIAWRVTEGYLLQLHASRATRANVKARIACGVPFPSRTDVWRHLRELQEAEHLAACGALPSVPAAPADDTSESEAPDVEASRCQQATLFPLEDTP